MSSLPVSLCIGSELIDGSQILMVQSATSVLIFFVIMLLLHRINNQFHVFGILLLKLQLVLNIHPFDAFLCVENSRRTTKGT